MSVDDDESAHRPVGSIGLEVQGAHGRKSADPYVVHGHGVGWHMFESLGIDEVLDAMKGCRHRARVELHEIRAAGQ